MRMRGRKMLAGSIVSVLALGLMASAAATSEVSKTPDPHDRINIWEGHWKVQAQRKETPYSHAGSAPFDAVCSWTADRGYMVCEYLSEKTVAGEGKPADHLSIFTYDENAGRSRNHRRECLAL
jgi:hypothetical protein